MGSIDGSGPWEPTIIYVPAKGDDAPKPYCNAQLALCLPHEELEVVVSSFTSLQVDGNIATGALSSLGAQLLLVHDGQERIKPLQAAGTFKLWIRDGSVVEYLLDLAGILKINRQQILVQQKSRTILSNIGTAEVALTDEVRRKLER
jgi:hypothetical protein